MPKCLMVYFSQTGSTEQVAGKISAGLRGAGWDVDLHNMNGERPPDVGGYDLLGIGSPVYYFRPPFNVSAYLGSLPALKGLPVFIFVTHGALRFDGANPIRRALALRGAREVGYFQARGPDLFVGYLKEGYLFSPGHPVAAELAGAERFGRDVAAHAEGKGYARPENDRPAPFIYRLERFLTGRWFARNVYSRLFRVNKGKCTACGVCIKLCPSGNITEGKGRRPVWGRDCLLCLTCELRCPEEAVTSPASWTLFRPFMIYNTRRAAREPSIDHVRIAPEDWSRVAARELVPAKSGGPDEGDSGEGTAK
jgi:flavodoxin/Pyruvate/2-oxoacid:ferredoxin oxidoreductase delta subunit